jgi:hypothetical protein
MHWPLGDARLGPIHLDIEQPDEPYHAVRAFAVEQLVQCVANPRVSVDIEGEPLVAVALGVSDPLGGL